MIDQEQDLMVCPEIYYIKISLANDKKERMPLGHSKSNLVLFTLYQV